MPHTVLALCDDDIPLQVSHISYSEFFVKNVTCESAHYEYSSYPGLVWPVIRYRVFLFRTTSSYFTLFSVVRLAVHRGPQGSNYYT